MVITPLVQDMTSTGFKPVFVDAATETDPKICGSIGAGGRKDTTAAQVHIVFVVFLCFDLNPTVPCTCS